MKFQRKQPPATIYRAKLNPRKLMPSGVFYDICYVKVVGECFYSANSFCGSDVVFVVSIRTLKVQVAKKHLLMQLLFQQG